MKPYLDVRVGETLVMEDVACCNPNRVGCSSLEGFILGLELEDLGHYSLEELGNMAVCDGATFTFVVSFRGLKDSQWFLSRYVQALGSLHNAKNCTGQNFGSSRSL